MTRLGRAARRPRLLLIKVVLPRPTLYGCGKIPGVSLFGPEGAKPLPTRGRRTSLFGRKKSLFTNLGNFGRKPLI